MRLVNRCQHRKARKWSQSRGRRTAQDQDQDARLDKFGCLVSGILEKRREDRPGSALQVFEGVFADMKSSLMSSTIGSGQRCSGPVPRGKFLRSAGAMFA